MDKSPNKRLTLNSIYLYIRMFILMAVSLYTSRVVLHALGAVDYGLYNVVGGIVAMFSFINNAMINSTQRFITFELGKKKLENLNKVFVTSINIHGLISLIIVVFTECLGSWFIYNKLNIPPQRLNACLLLLQFSILSTVFTIMSVPYDALIIAHERMSAFAYISILDAIFKLIIAYLITISSKDRLVQYGFLLLIVTIIDRLIYNIYCNRHFKESKYRFIFDKKLTVEMLRFAGWSLFGNLAYVMSTEGINLLLNIFFTPVINAARGLAVQVQGALINFSQSIENAIKPQITKSYAESNVIRFNTLVYADGRFSFYALLLVALPVIIETPEILGLWLKEIPKHTICFLRLILVITLIDSLSNPLLTSVQASGKVKKYQTTVGLVYLSILPLSYLVLKKYTFPEVVLLVNLVIIIILQFCKLKIVCPIIHISQSTYIKKVYIRALLVFFISFFVVFVLKYLLERGIVRLLLVVLVSSITILTLVFFIGMDTSEQAFVKQKIINYLKNKK